MSPGLKLGVPARLLQVPQVPPHRLTSISATPDSTSHPPPPQHPNMLCARQSPYLGEYLSHLTQISPGLKLGVPARLLQVPQVPPTPPHIHLCHPRLNLTPPPPQHPNMLCARQSPYLGEYLSHLTQISPGLKLGVPARLLQVPQVPHTPPHIHLCHPRLNLTPPTAPTPKHALCAPIAISRRVFVPLDSNIARIEAGGPG